MQEPWRQALKEGSIVDAIKGDFKCKSWGKAQVVKIDEEDFMRLEFLEESPIYDKSLSKWSSDVAEEGTQSNVNDWKLSLKEGDQIDAFDKAKSWYASTILSIKENQTQDGRTFKVAEIGFRIFSENGKKAPETEGGKRYDGWSSKFDEWLPLNSPKIEKLYTQAKPHGAKGPTQRRLYEEPQIEDGQDEDWIEGEPKQYAVFRPRKCKSSLLNRTLNLLGQAGGYDKILTRLRDSENAVSFEQIENFMDIIGSNYHFFHRQFVKEFVPEIKRGIENCILNSPDSIIRNVRQETIEGIVKKLEDLLKRVMKTEDREKEIELLNLSIIMLCFKSSFLERRIHGIKVLSDLIKRLKYQTTNHEAQAFMLKWLRDNKIIEIIYDQKNYHIQIVQRSNELIRFFVEQDDFSDADLDLFWNSHTWDLEVEKEVYKMISQCATAMGPSLTGKFLDRLT